MTGGEIIIGVNDDEGQDWIFEARDDENHAIIDDGSVYVHGNLNGNNHDNVASITLNGGTVNAQNIEMPGADGPATGNINGGLFKARDTLRVGGGEGTVNVAGGNVECEHLEVGDDGMVNITGTGVLTVLSASSLHCDGGKVNVEDGTLILAGDQVAAIEAAAEAGCIGGYYNATYGVFRGELVIEFDGTNTIVTAVPPDPCKSWGPSPADNATEIGAVTCNLILEWQTADCVPTKGRHFIYFGTDEDAVATCPGPPSAGPEYRGMNFAVDLDWDIGTLPLWQTFYWRIDEGCHDGSVCVGPVWNFSTGCAIIGGDTNLDCLVNFIDYAAVASTFNESQYFPDGCTP
jgi:hypothetical protein